MAKKQGSAKPSKNLSPKELEYHAALINLHDQMAAQIRTLGSASLKSSKQAGEELADVGSDDFIRDTELTLMSEEEERLLLVESAIERLEEGTYGSCQDCGCDIPEARLKAKPYARLCVECKSTREEQAGLVRRR